MLMSPMSDRPSDDAVNPFKMIIFQHKNFINIFKKLFLINIKVEYKKFHLKLWISWSSNWWSGLRWCDCDVQIIANLKSRL